MIVKSLSINAQAILWVTASTGLFSIVFASGKFAGEIASPLQILFIRYIAGFLTLVLVNVFRGQNLKAYRSQTPVTHLYRAFFGAFGGVSTIYAAKHMPIVDATAIGLLDCVFLVMFGIYLFNEKISGKHLLAILICIAGAIVMLSSQGLLRSFHSAYIFPALIALLGALLIALEAIMIKKLSVLEHPMTVLLYVNFFGAFLLFIPALIDWQSINLLDNLPFLLLGPLAVFAQYLTIRGYQIADICVVGPIKYTWIIFAALIGFFIFDEVPSQLSIVGALMIISGGVILAIHKNNT